MPQVASIRVHNSRAEQVRLIAAARGLTIAGAIERFIASEIKAGTIPDALPGFDAKAEAGSVVVTIEGQALPAFAPKTAAAVAEFIERLATTRGRDAGGGFHLSDGSTLAVARKGTAIVVRILDAAGGASETATLTFSMAGDFCRALNTATHIATYQA